MRIIRMLVGVIGLIMIMALQANLALAASDSNETKTEFKIEDNVALKNGIVSHKYQIESVGGPYNFEGYVPLKTPLDLEREVKLMKWEVDRRNSRLPEGAFTINASAYTAAADECGKSDGITASGLRVKESETIACPPQFPFGTKLDIKGMGTYICEDRGGAIKVNHIDIYMETKKEAFAFGRRNLLAEVVF